LTDCQWLKVEKYLNKHKPKKHDIRMILNAILWITRTGSQWRNMESRYPKWESVYYYFNIWRSNGILSLILNDLVKEERVRQGRKATPSAGAIDSQSVKICSFQSESVGIDGGKKINGRKRHILVDTLGLPIAIHVSSANTSDAVGGFDLLAQTDHVEESLKLIRGDKAYGKIFKEAASWYNFEVDTSQRPPSEKGFIPQKGRWQVERSFGWMGFYRRLSKDYEKTPQAAIAFIQLMFINIILGRIT
jgi:putative transposase